MRCRLNEEWRLRIQIILLLLAAIPFAWFLLLGVMLAVGAERVSVRTMPPVAREGGNVWVICRIQRHEDNRKLRISVPHHRASDYELDGKVTPITFSLLVKDVPCLPVMAAVCLLETNHDYVLASTPLKVLGCGEM